MANNREISQFAGLVTVNDANHVSIGASLIVGTGIIFNAGSSTAQFDARVDVGSTSHDKHSLVAINNSHQTVVVAIAHSTAACFEGRSDASTTTSLIDNDGCLKIGGTLPSSPNIQLRADGSATLAKWVTATESVNGRNIQAGGGDGNNTIFYGASDTAMTNPVFRVWTDGSMYAADDLFAIASTADTRIGTDNITISGEDTRSKVHIDPGGWIGSGNVYPPCVAVYAPINASASKYVWVCYDDDNIGTSSYITASGGASFGGGATGISSSGTIDVRNYYNTSGSDSTFPAFAVKNYSGTTKTQLFADGAATFAGQILSSNTGGNVYINTGNAGNALQAYDSTANGAVAKVSITKSGAAVFASTVTCSSLTETASDQRFKKNITDANPQLADVTALGEKLRNWDWTDDAPVYEKDTRFLGLIAQEVESICPGIIHTVPRTKDGPTELTPEVVTPAVYETQQDEDGKDIQVEVTPEKTTPATYEQVDDSYKTIKTSVLIMKLLGAVTELSAKVAALEAA